MGRDERRCCSRACARSCPAPQRHAVQHGRRVWDGVRRRESAIHVLPTSTPLNHATPLPQVHSVSSSRDDLYRTLDIDRHAERSRLRRARRRPSRPGGARGAVVVASFEPRAGSAAPLAALRRRPRGWRSLHDEGGGADLGGAGRTLWGGRGAVIIACGRLRQNKPSWPAPWRRSSCASSSPTRWRRPGRGGAAASWCGCRPSS